MPGMLSFQVIIIAQATVLKRINMDRPIGAQRLSQPLLHTTGASTLSAIL